MRRLKPSFLICPPKASRLIVVICPATIRAEGYAWDTQSAELACGGGVEQNPWNARVRPGGSLVNGLPKRGLLVARCGRLERLSEMRGYLFTTRWHPYKQRYHTTMSCC